MKIGPDSFVTIHYSLSPEGQDSPCADSGERKASFVFGRARLLPALEAALVGREEADEVDVRIPPENACGPYDPSLVSDFPVSNLRYPERLRVGERYEETDGWGRPVAFTVLDVRDGIVRADFNNPQAGKAFMLRARVTEVRPAGMLEILGAMSMSLPRGGG